VKENPATRRSINHLHSSLNFIQTARFPVTRQIHPASSRKALFLGRAVPAPQVPFRLSGEVGIKACMRTPLTGQRVRADGYEGEFIVVRVHKTKSTVDLMLTSGDHGISKHVPWSAISLVDEDGPTRPSTESRS